MGVIVTIIYGIQTLEGRKDDSFFLKIKDTAERKNIETFFIKLEYSSKELKKRIVSKEREKYKKLTNYKTLQKIRKDYKVDSNVLFLKSKTIDTSKMNLPEITLNIKKASLKKTLSNRG